MGTCPLAHAGTIALLLFLFQGIAAGLQAANTTLEVCRPTAVELTDQGIGILDDPTCATDNGCINSHCRLCQLYPTLMSAKYLPCSASIRLPEPVVIVPRPAPVAVISTSAPITSAPAPVTSVPASVTLAPAPDTLAPVPDTLAPVPDTSAPVLVTGTPNTSGDSGDIPGFVPLPPSYDPSTTGDSDIPSTTADALLDIDPLTQVDADTDAAIGTVGTWTICKTKAIAEQKEQHGLDIVTDLNCQLPDGKFPYGCFSSVCRYCNLGVSTVDLDTTLAPCSS